MAGPSAKASIGITLLATILGDVCIFLVSANSMSFVPYITVTTFAPLTALCVYIWGSGRAARFINIPGKAELDEDSLNSIGSIISIYVAAGLVIMSAGISLMFCTDSGLYLMGTCIAVGIFLIAAGIIIGIVRGRGRHAVERSPSAILSVLLLSLMLVITPAVVSASSEYTTDRVSVELGDSSFTVRAPMFDETFRYGEVQSCALDDGFDFGSRISGFRSFDITSGKWTNDELGTYKLAAYSDCRTCIVITADGSYYVFNQSDDANTRALYAELVSHL